MNPISLLDEWIVKITALSGPTLLIVTLWMIGYFFKLIQWFPNRFIPIVTFLLAVLMTPFVVLWPASGDQPQGLRWPEITAWVQTFDRAVLLWALAWLTHATALKKLIDEKLNGALTHDVQRETFESKEVTPAGTATVSVETTVKPAEEKKP